MELTASALALISPISACSPTTAMRLFISSLSLMTFAVSAALVVSGCGHRVTPTTPRTTAELPVAWHGKTAQGESLPYWLSGLNDPDLEQLVRTAWSANPDVVASAARYEQAVARAQQSGALRLPAVNLDAGVGRSRTNVATSSNVTPIYRNDFNLGLSVGWEIDVWGRLSSLARADVADATAARHDTIAAYRSLAAQVARAWYRLGYEQLRLALIEDFHAVATITERLLSERYVDGRTPAVDVRAARADLERAKIDVAERQRAVKSAARALEALLGKYPAGGIKGPSDLAVPPPAPPAGVPATALMLRPDLQSAHQRLLASDERLAGANADLLPRFSLTASGGTRSNELRDVFDPEYIVWNLLGNLTQPLFDAGRRNAVVDERHARVREAAANWASSAINALKEVETALANGEIIQDQVLHGQRAAEESDAVVINLRERYRDGLSDGLTLLREQRTALNQRITLLALRLDQLLIRIDLLLALGGASLADEADVMNRATNSPTTSPMITPKAGDKP